MTVHVETSICQDRKAKVPDQQLVFGRTFTDHMFVADYSEGAGWHDFRIQPYQPLVLDPSAIVLHYGQTVFEGLKAYKSPTGKVRLFRPRLNFERMNESCTRMCMPTVDPDAMLDSLVELLRLEKDWIPTAPGTSLYIRPFMIATEAYLGVAPSQKYQFMIILSPVGSYYKEGIAPVKILVESQYVRAVAGGTGTAKTAGNYAASLKAQQAAGSEGYAQVMWLDGVERKYIEEVGSMNVFFKIDGKVYTPALNGSILDGITRRSIIDILRYWEVPVIERRISMEEIREAHRTGKLEEAWGTGTAAVISPIGEFKWQNELFYVNNGQTGELSARLYDTITGLQTGEMPDPFGWTIEFE
ncbi:branched chain amino acid aminotransferase [Chryseomicrobium excrementi]|uniref:Branched-chain-amino-acid aminotransferase n=1 Tax=Chryseomicrobium excrementi TaxID=2041346 RepID=A0A2M9F117_9BACL|nr:branched-chain amino acid aminotransferase [Chryseomicrobium excrementi]PJK17150.1 branched chain amino acid aminotransferase [Chryseomicrobium excrementi]